MWVEVTFEVFTTCIVACMLVQMGLLEPCAMAERVIFIAVMMFLVTAVVGISHNFYLDRTKPTGHRQRVLDDAAVLPLLMTLDAVAHAPSSCGRDVTSPRAGSSSSWTESGASSSR